MTPDDNDEQRLVEIDKELEQLEREKRLFAFLFNMILIVSLFGLCYTLLVAER